MATQSIIPTDPIQAAIWGLNLAIEAFQIPADYAALQNTLAARAQAAGRDMTPDEEAMDDALLAASQQARDGQ